MSEDKNGLIGKVFKFLFIIVFFLIGVATIVIGSLSLKNEWYKEYDMKKWIPIVHIVLGALLLTSPFFLNKKREGFNKFLRILMIIIFLIIGILFIVAGAVALDKGWYEAYKWYPICNIVFGCILFTSPYFFRKD